MAAKERSAKQQNLAKVAKANAEEAAARESRYPDAIHEDTAAAREAKLEKVKAEDELYRLQQEEAEGDLDTSTVTLVGPSEVTVTDSNGVEFVDGKAEVPKYLAERYVDGLEGYEIEGSSSSSSSSQAKSQ